MIGADPCTREQTYDFLLQQEILWISWVYVGLHASFHFSLCLRWADDQAGTMGALIREWRLPKNCSYPNIFCSAFFLFLNLIINLSLTRNLTTLSAYTAASEPWRVLSSSREFLLLRVRTVSQTLSYDTYQADWSSTNPLFQAPFPYDMKSVTCSRIIPSNGISSVWDCFSSRKWMRVISCPTMESLVSVLWCFDIFLDKDFSSRSMSLFCFAGIHGLPYRAWNGVTGIDNQQTGYCTHSSILFLPWHRPYLCLFEVRETI